ncbi:tetratricopeptide repeat protein [Bacillus atrophaeus]|uniref:response regulator aspartate phosphatase n=2 Tax=Bacillus atrophaeus TaxID=1452 RepID=UPI002280B5CE|nr:tetratricopeptide repeat protein [Bacillus atrophaeus]MCY8497772.1 tetratricopeptide repeat protein [Bacillus atrophaeus]MCY8814923.1 tetratricopeptide repeat protein [Bacillus atrophaeus]MCY8821575.1 tetratricopeptide repeat protein [Bacillus atrophaeus]MCY8831005.1 tetratricopeptide repeat protein [Bacillus atrophaeus]MCY8835220.1 tetratricopeptide repeat protein [Bacillus atrophaeus]
MKNKMLPSSEVGNKINEWYGYIRTFSIPDAEVLKNEIKEQLDQMEEDQDLLLYYSLMEFRHRLMLESLEPLENMRIEQQPSLSDLLSDIERKQVRIKGVLDYYYNFFRGQYEFYQKNYIEAINCYKLAELKLNVIPQDEKIERAEFHYKVAAAYYRIKQNMFSLHHAEIALNMFKKNEDYITKTISSEMMLGANKLDLLRHDEAEEHYKNALISAEIADDRLSIGLACYNIGLSYAFQNKNQMAEEYFRKALAIREHYASDKGVKTTFELAFVLFKNEKTVEAQNLLDKGLKQANKEGEEEYLAKFNIIRAMYCVNESSEKKRLLDNSFRYLEGKKLWVDVEELSQEVADYYRIFEDHQNTILYLDKVIHAKNQILRVSEELE